jgi:hypothetical protein
MYFLAALAIFPLISGKPEERTPTFQGVAVRVPLGRSFRHRPPFIVTPHVLKVFDVRIAVSDFIHRPHQTELAEHDVNIYRSCGTIES